MCQRQIFADGRNHWQAPGIFRSLCKMDVRYLPFDVQKCVLKFGSWDHDANELLLLKHPSHPITEKYIPSSEWDLVHVDVSVNTVKYTCCDHPYQDMAFKFVIHRRPLYYVFNIIIPCIILMCLVLFSFFLPPDSGERITIVVTILLAFTVILQMLNQSMPRNSDCAPVLLVFYVVIMAESTFSLFTTCLVLVAHYRGEDHLIGSPPACLMKFTKKISHSMCVYQNKDAFKQVKTKPTANGIPFQPISNENDEEELANKVSVDYIQHEKLDSVLAELETITTQMRDMDMQDQCEMEWKQLARVLDRMFFFLILFSYIVSSVGILVPAYFGHSTEDRGLSEEQT